MLAPSVLTKPTCRLISTHSFDWRWYLVRMSGLLVGTGIVMNTTVQGRIRVRVSIRLVIIDESWLVRETPRVVQEPKPIL